MHIDLLTKNSNRIEFILGQCATKLLATRHGPACLRPASYHVPFLQVLPPPPIITSTDVICTLAESNLNICGIIFLGLVFRGIMFLGLALLAWLHTEGLVEPACQTGEGKSIPLLDGGKLLVLNGSAGPREAHVQGRRGYTVWVSRLEFRVKELKVSGFGFRVSG